MRARNSSGSPKRLKGLPSMAQSKQTAVARQSRDSLRATRALSRPSFAGMHPSGKASAGRRALSRPAWSPWSRCSCWPRSRRRGRAARSTPVAASPARSPSASAARRACPTPAAITPWSPPTAGRSPASPAPSPRPRRPLPGPAGLPLVPVDFRYCRRESCAVAAGPHLTASRRRTTAFTQIEDRRRTLGWVELTYWLYRPASAGNASPGARAKPRSKPRPAPRSCSATTRTSSRSRPSPAATTTTSLPRRTPALAVARPRPLPRLVELTDCN